jgi:hypothetical protein
MRNFYCSLARILIGVSVLVMAPLCAHRLSGPLIKADRTCEGPRIP